MDISISGSLEGDLGIEKMINNLKEIDGKAVEAGIFGGFEQKKQCGRNMVQVGASLQGRFLEMLSMKMNHALLHSFCLIFRMS